MKYDSAFDLINTDFIILISFMIICFGFDIPSFYFIAPLNCITNCTYK
ncbi:MAG: hypothetical protein K2M08_07820 [Anaeroplasmataceae bacterium]|nr:hypothetical protein [Anaeroplasmataceae bacterium]